MAVVGACEEKCVNCQITPTRKCSSASGPVILINAAKPVGEFVQPNNAPMQGANSERTRLGRGGFATYRIQRRRLFQALQHPSVA